MITGINFHNETGVFSLEIVFFQVESIILQCQSVTLSSLTLEKTDSLGLESWSTAIISL